MVHYHYVKNIIIPTSKITSEIFDKYYMDCDAKVWFFLLFFFLPFPVFLSSSPGCSISWVSEGWNNKTRMAVQRQYEQCNQCDNESKFKNILQKTEH